MSECRRQTLNLQPNLLNWAFFFTQTFPAIGWNCLPCSLCTKFMHCTQVCTHTHTHVHACTHTSTLLRILSTEPCPLVHTRAQINIVNIKGWAVLQLSLCSDWPAQTQASTISTHQSSCRQITMDAGRWWATRTSRRWWRPSVSVLPVDDSYRTSEDFHCNSVKYAFRRAKMWPITDDVS